MFSELTCDVNIIGRYQKTKNGKKERKNHPKKSCKLDTDDLDALVLLLSSGASQHLSLGPDDGQAPKGGNLLGCLSQTVRQGS